MAWSGHDASKTSDDGNQVRTSSMRLGPFTSFKRYILGLIEARLTAFVGWYDGLTAPEPGDLVRPIFDLSIVSSDWYSGITGWRRVYVARTTETFIVLEGPTLARPTQEQLILEHAGQMLAVAESQLLLFEVIARRSDASAEE